MATIIAIESIFISNIAAEKNNFKERGNWYERK